ncbi:OmpW/AlkL family protein [Arenimonas fontis]|uniref:OmpW family protein n=1 Tax=Arenimonas fontis TaxID=2608255 RepID=A0A5B2ZD55_9GAMM|nr:OmpW family outer membrane protein [Arenimonas fontis]KAA2285042.1 OmpW family protein [Arenimonas fontis]
MRRTPLSLLALASALAIAPASAQDFSATIGYQNVNPKSGNGTLAGAEADVNDDWSLTGSVAWHFADNWSAELWSGLARFEHEVSLAGLGTVAGVEHRPTTLGINYHFMSEGRFRPFVGLGYGWVSLSGERTLGPLAGLGIRADDANGISFNAGADVYFTENFFLRLDVRKLDFDTDVSIETLGNVGTAEVDPLVYGLSAGIRF